MNIANDIFQPKLGPTLSEEEIRAYTWMITNNHDSKNNNNNNQDKSVIVVGAGLAGLSAARELLKAGVGKVTILEKTARVGGRCYTASTPEGFSEGVFAEAGGMRFPDSHSILTHYLDLFSIEKVPFSNMKDKDGLFFFRGVKTSMQKELSNPESLVARVIAKWAESIQPIQIALKNGSITWEGVIDKYSDTSLGDFLQDSHWSQELIGGISKYGLGIGAMEPVFGISFLEVLRLFIKGHGEENYQVKGGVEKLVHAFLHDESYPLHEHLRCNCSVVSVQQIDNCNGYSNRVVFVSSDTSDAATAAANATGGDGQDSLVADFVILTTPLPDLSKISFQPTLDSHLQRAIQESHYVRAVKIILQTKSPFWLDNHGVDGMLLSDTMLQSTYFMPPFPDCQNGIIIASYVWERQADKIYQLSNQEKVDMAIQELSQVFPEIRQQVQCGFCVEWKQAFCLFHPGQMKQHFQVLRQCEVAPNIFLAGEACSVEHGYFEGALETGLRAAANILRRIDPVNFKPQFDDKSKSTQESSQVK